MKMNKIKYIILYSLIAFFVGVFIFVFVVIPFFDSTKLSNNDIENQEKVEKESKIETFLQIKDLGYHLMARETSSDNYDYYVDIDNVLFFYLEELQYDEIDLKTNSYVSLYELKYGKENSNSEVSNVLYNNVVTICKNNIIKVEAHAGEKFHLAYKERFYVIHEDKYNNLLEKIEYVIENNKK